MSTINLRSWSQYAKIISEIRDKYGIIKEGKGQKSLILFRGQPNDKWKLETTLERYSKDKWTLKSYAELVGRCAPEVESFTGRDFKLPEYWKFSSHIEKEFDEAHRSGFAFQMLVKPALYDYLAYLRHHRFPSPLLDWSRSPYVAAYFAFFSTGKESETVSLYAFVERPFGIKGYDYRRARIEVLDPYTKSHRRHFQQQSYYTVCYKPIVERKDLIFACHDDIFSEKQAYTDEQLGQDIFIKINIPITEKIKALNELNDFNINAFNLMQSEDALMDTMAFKEIAMKENP